MADVAPIPLAATFVGTLGGSHESVVKEPVAPALSPAALVAMTSMEYSVPELRPEYEMVVSWVVCASPPFSVTSYVTGHGDVEAPQVIVAVFVPTSLAVTAVGVDGNVHGEVAKEPIAGLAEPPAFVATTRISYVVSGVRPVY